MFKLFKLLLAVAGLAVFVWVGANIPLGSRTLFEHLQAIGRTRETQDLLDGTKKAGKPFVDGVRDGVRRRLGGTAAEVGDEGDSAARAATVSPDGGAPPADRVTDDDREKLRKVLGAKADTKSETKTETKTATKTATKTETKTASKTDSRQDRDRAGPAKRSAN